MQGTCGKSTGSWYDTVHRVADSYRPRTAFIYRRCASERASVSLWDLHCERTTYDISILTGEIDLLNLSAPTQRPSGIIKAGYWAGSTATYRVSRMPCSRVSWSSQTCGAKGEAASGKATAASVSLTLRSYGECCITSGGTWGCGKGCLSPLLSSPHPRDLLATFCRCTDCCSVRSSTTCVSPYIPAEQRSCGAC